MFTVAIICQRIDDMLIKTIHSLEALEPQVIVGISEGENLSFGKRKNALLGVAAGEWVLILDTDEVASPQLVREIQDILIKSPYTIHGYEINYQNYAFGKAVHFGGEKYAKVRLFRKKYGHVNPVPLHEEVVVQGAIAKLKGIIHHHSYRTLPQVLAKFTGYAWAAAGEKKKVRETVNLRKLFLYGPHMFWARAVKDEGWRDGWRGIVIALCFGYMETLMYWMLLWRNMIGR